MSDDLDIFRNKINSIDNELVRLLNDRMNLSIEIGKYKKSRNMKVFDKEREEVLLNRLIEINNKIEKNKLNEEFIRNLWDIIMNFSKSLQS
tara:strand:- start:99 stop:371 length:273 start_codon:yes stop_codon:yes gene_type:complete